MFKATREALKRRDIRSLDEPGNPRTKGMRQSSKAIYVPRVAKFMAKWRLPECREETRRVDECVMATLFL